MSYAQADLVKELLAVEEQLTQGHAWAGVELAPDDWSRLVRLARGEVLPARRPYPLAVLACSATKADVEACPARDLYTGDLFTAGRQLAEMVADEYVILSAHHGVVEPDDLLAPYNVGMGELPAPARAAWGSEAAKTLKQRIDNIRRGPVLWLAGDAYWKPVELELRDARQSYERPLRGLGIGEQKARLKGLIAEAEAQGYGAEHAAAERRAA